MSEDTSATSDDEKDFSESYLLPSTVPKITTNTLRVTLDLQFQNCTHNFLEHYTTLNIVIEFWEKHSSNVRKYYFFYLKDGEVEPKSGS